MLEINNIQICKVPEELTETDDLSSNVPRYIIKINGNWVVNRTWYQINNAWYWKVSWTQLLDKAGWFTWPMILEIFKDWELYKQ